MDGYLSTQDYYFGRIYVWRNRFHFIVIEKSGLLIELISLQRSK